MGRVTLTYKQTLPGGPKSKCAANDPSKTGADAFSESGTS